MQKFKPGVEPMILLFSDRAASRVFTFPWYYRFAAVVEPLLRQVCSFDILVTFHAVNLCVQNSGDSCKAWVMWCSIKPSHGLQSHSYCWVFWRFPAVHDSGVAAASCSPCVMLYD